jgi:hypothetical protein
MCASNNTQVRRHAPLVLGNIAQNEACREAVGDRGGIEALILILEKNDQSMLANSLWVRVRVRVRVGKKLIRRDNPNPYH